MSLPRETALAEADHQIAVQPVRPRSKRTIHELQIRVERMIDLVDLRVLRGLGVSNDDLAGDDFTACQAVGGAAAYLELDGLLVPSARAPGSNLVILFVDFDPSPTIEIIESEPA